MRGIARRVSAAPTARAKRTDERTDSVQPIREINTERYRFTTTTSAETRFPGPLEGGGGLFSLLNTLEIDNTTCHDSIFFKSRSRDFPSTPYPKWESRDFTETLMDVPQITNSLINSPEARVKPNTFRLKAKRLVLMRGVAQLPSTVLLPSGGGRSLNYHVRRSASPFTETRPMKQRWGDTNARPKTRVVMRSNCFGFCADVPSEGTMSKGQADNGGGPAQTLRKLVPLTAASKLDTLVKRIGSYRAVRFLTKRATRVLRMQMTGFRIQVTYTTFKFLYVGY
ncbi:hypothetical protein EVAR_59483_1 [Eumeta japonica]|uniref:Uncharacterized protein n=1 Tax=Eumeta variegata TaxID=151549 RepID=A0A4C1Z218_EUMVA|nr:hypothetical protein EVAR_59483_1 [Eumeta japonica]